MIGRREDKPPIWTRTRLSSKTSLLCLLLISAGQIKGFVSQGEAPRSDVTHHPITIAETLARRKPSEVHISPDGSHLTYVVTHANRESNQDEAVLYVADAMHRGLGRALANAIHITTVRWSRDGRWLYFVSEIQSGRNIWRVAAEGGKPQELAVVHGELVYTPEYEGGNDPYQLSPDGKTLIYAAYDTAAAKREVEERMKSGVLYKGEPYYRFRLFRCSKSQLAPFELWSYDLDHRRTRRLWEAPIFLLQGSMAPEFRISPDGKSLALLYETSNESHHALAVLDLANGKVNPLLSNLAHSYSLKWSDDGKSLLFVSQGGELHGDQSSIATTQQYTLSLFDRNLRPDKDADLAFLTGPDPVAKAVEQKTGNRLHNCSLSADKTRAACIEESPMIPPEVVSVVVHDRSSEGKPLVLTHLNPAYDVIELGQVSSLSWSDKKGEGGQPQAGLILPANYISNERYPLLVVLYNVYSGRRFNSESYASYPTQAFAGHGYAVLLMNVPEGWFVYKDGDFTAAKAAEVDSVVAAVRSAVDLLIARGIVDSKRMGIMGWSYGSFWTDYIVTHYPDWFQAAASGEGGNHEPGSYWIWGDGWKDQEDRFFGGGPYGRFYSRWKEVAPVLNVDRLRAPLLMEYTGANLNGIEMRTAILEQGGQAELVIYPDEEHVFQRPLNRFNSMTTHFDWFNFWLLGEEDPDPAKREQYVRWRQMRQKVMAGKEPTKFQ